MNKLNLLQERKIKLLFGFVAFIGGLTTLMVYIQNRKTKKEEDEIRKLEKELKILQIDKIKKTQNNRRY